MSASVDAPVPALKSRIKTLVQAAVPGQSGFRLLLSGQEAFSARAEAIAQATDTIDLQYYITHDGISTRLLLDELLQAANRGVRIRLLLDDFASDARDHRVLLCVAHSNIKNRTIPVRPAGSALTAMGSAPKG
jgi:putative cardiolipin synthase